MLLNVRNNNRHIGKANAKKSNIKKFMVIAVLGWTVLTTTGCHREKAKAEEIVETTVEPNYLYSYEPRYDGIEYEVQWGDTLTEIVAAYESDYNKILTYVDDIERLNKIKGVLREGITIKLVGVPESKLANYGYTSDYSLIGDDVMVEDAYAWLLEERQWILESELNQDLVDKFNIDFTEFVVQYNAYLTEEDEDLKQAKLAELVRLLEDVLEQFKTLTGLDFSQHHKAYPIPSNVTFENTL